MLAGLALWLVKFQVSGAVQQGIAGGVVVGHLVWAIRGTPTSRLLPERRAAREDRQMASLLGGSVGVLLLGGYVAALQLRSWSEWVVLGGYILVTIGVGLALHTHLYFRRR